MTFDLAELEPGVRVGWAQQIHSTPFERSVRSSLEVIEVEAADSGSRVSLSIVRKLKGTAKLGAYFVAKGQQRELESAALTLSEVLG